jgi:hypothetical protein
MDERGDHGLTLVNISVPVFLLSDVLIKEEDDETIR